MKKLFILGLVLLMVVVFATTVCGKAQKVDLIPCTITYADPEAENYPPGGGFVIFNNSSGTEHNLEVTVSLKGVERDTDYDIWLILFVGGVRINAMDKKLGTVKSNAAGNANLHMNVLLDPGTYDLTLDVVYEGTGGDIYETPGIHAGDGTSMTFE